MQFFVHFCSRWQQFNWLRALRGPSAVADVLYWHVACQIRDGSGQPRPHMMYCKLISTQNSSNSSTVINRTSGQRLMTKGRIAGGAFFTAVNEMWHRPVGSIAVGCHTVTGDRMIRFTAYTAAETTNIFQWAEQLPKIALSVGSRPHLIHGSLGPP